ncbi:MAG: Endonuclease/exonuclease/phosphatase [Planctomycetaceae bacterium]|nr:Endonuclease/exonuclease/phosphatase [Planctomycetaceae bacterium]
MSAIMTEPQPSSMALTQRPHAWRPCVLTFVIIAAGLAGLGYWVANWEWPAGAANGTGLLGSPPVVDVLPSKFRIATFNIHGGFGMDGKLDLQRTADALRDVDFVGLNEVRGPGWQDPRNQAEQLGTILGLGWLFAPTEITRSGPHFGQGLLSRLPISSWKRVPFARVNGNGYRNYVECQIPIRTGDSTAQLTILVTHLDRKTDRQDQLRVIIRRFLEVSPPAILMGDLNSKRTEPQLIALASEPGVNDCFSQLFPSDLARKRIDWVFTRGLKCLQSDLKSSTASDHPVGWAELELSDHQSIR